MSIPAAFADSFSFTDDVVCVPPIGDEITPGCENPIENPGDVTVAILTALGMSTASETLAIGFTTPFDVTQPGVPPDTVTFTFMRDTGVFEFSFGFCPVSAITVDPDVDIQQFAEDCLNNATEIFDDSSALPGTDGSNPTPTAAQLLSGDTLTLVMPAPGVDLYFYLLPNNNLAHFVANPGDYYPPQTVLNPFRAPLFSFTAANPGECPDDLGSPTDGCDQLLGFTGPCEIDGIPATTEGCTIFMFEDLSRDEAGMGVPSDEDFTDIAFIVDAIFPPIIVDPCLGPNPPMDICPGGEFLPVDSSALLLAGLQTSAVWILPILLAGAGVAAFQLRRK